MEILYVSSVPSGKEFYRIKKTIKDNINVTTYGMNESGFKFHSLILDGLSDNDNVNILSLVGRSVSQKTHKHFFWKTRKEQGKKNIYYKHLGFLNIFFIKPLGLCLSFFFNTLIWLIKYRKQTDKYIIMDASYVTAVPFVMAAAKIIPCKTSAIFCDIYEYMGNVKDARETEKTSGTHRFFRNIMAKKYGRLDSFILLTEQMNQVVNLSKKPYVIIEGLVDIHMKEHENRIEDKAGQYIVMYAGALREQYGLKNLIVGFMNYHNEDARLWIFGAGDYSDEIKKASYLDKRIVFYGLANLDEVVKKESEANVLINPRSADREFTQYSFPSKNMEYMVSGTPVLTTRLPGMPKEYYGYIDTIDGNEPEDITIALKKIFANSMEELHDKGKKAKEFVLKNKNNMIQTQKILELLAGRQ